MKASTIVGFLNGLQNDIEPLPEPLRTIFLVLFLLGAVVIPISTCVYSIVRRIRAKKRIRELGASWEDFDGKIPKPEDAMIVGVQGIAIIALVVFAGVVWVLWQMFGSIIRDFAVIILFGFAIILIVVICPVALIWGVRVDDKRNAARIRLAEDYQRMKETGEVSE